MKIDHPSYSEARNYFANNRKHFNMLSEYYSVHDKDYYEEVFLKIKNKYPSGKTDSLCNPGKHTIMLCIGLLMVLYYFLPLNFETDETAVQKNPGSMELKLTDNSYFVKAVKKFDKGKYTSAKEYFLKVESDDENYLLACEILKTIDEKIDEEGFAISEADETGNPIY